jgi:hypothetical protein
MTDKQIERIKKTIKIYRARLAAEKRRFHGYFDNGGSRYIIPEFYLKIADYKGALTYFRWFTKEFPDDSGFPSLNLFWTLTLYQNKKIKEANSKAYKTAFSNTYLIDLICNKETIGIDKSELDGSESLVYAKQIVEGYIKLLTPEFKEWICRLNETEDFKSNLNRFISLQKLIKDESTGPSRSRLINESSKLEVLLTGQKT